MKIQKQYVNLAARLEMFREMALKIDQGVIKDFVDRELPKAQRRGTHEAFCDIALMLLGFKPAVYLSKERGTMLPIEITDFQRTFLLQLGFKLSQNIKGQDLIWQPKVMAELHGIPENKIQGQMDAITDFDMLKRGPLLGYANSFGPKNIFRVGVFLAENLYTRKGSIHTHTSMASNVIRAHQLADHYCRGTAVLAQLSDALPKPSKVSKFVVSFSDNVGVASTFPERTRFQLLFCAGFMIEGQPTIVEPVADDRGLLKGAKHIRGDEEVFLSLEEVRGLEPF